MAPGPVRMSESTGTVTIGQANDNNIATPSIFASYYHATLVLTPLGNEILDRSINGTFVNDIHGGSAIWTEGSVVIRQCRSDVQLTAPCYPTARRLRALVG
ncbi:FHA domain-containing protein [Mycobacterium uberis]|uniref:FHA domain-containing protein n=1 Tax=Mycobacterium uberis TaxID=2162698 RepID=UPI001FB32B50|nr:FHA domain-containing protein [Mycobacterium uberis]